MELDEPKVLKKDQANKTFDRDNPHLEQKEESLGPNGDRITNDNKDDEIFFGPIGHRENCVASILDRQALPETMPIESLSQSEQVSI